MPNSFRKILSLLLAALLILTLLPSAALAAAEPAALPAGETAAPEADEQAEPPAEDRSFGYIEDGVPEGSRALTDAYLQREQADGPDSGDLQGIPTKYDSRNYGYISAVQNQGSYGCCWAFANLCAAEAYMIKHGIPYTVGSSSTIPTSSSINLSETHLSWFSYTYAYDRLGMLDGDYTSPVGANFLQRGGNGKMAAMTLMRWEGPASEAYSALAYSNVNSAASSGLSSSYAYNYDSAHVESVQWIPMANRNAVKEAIMEYGAVSVPYYHNDSYYNASHYAYCYKQTDFTSTNHGVTLIGWVNDFPASYFNSSYGPSQNGAWIAKNSWGTSWGNGGYFYLSFEDSASYNNTCFAYTVGPVDNYQNNYQYDGTTYSYVVRLSNNSKIANVFTANDNELLRAAAVCVADEAVSYRLQIYTNLTSAKNPTSGQKVADQTGYFSFPGYYTVPLNDPAHLAAGKKFSVVFTLSIPQSGGETKVACPFDRTFSADWVSAYHVDHGDTSFYSISGSSWYDCPSSGDFRIKAYTDKSFPFVDVPGKKYYYTPVYWAYFHDPQITGGTDATHFSPNATCTREQVVTFLWNAAGKPNPSNTSNPFTDVNPNKYYYKAVLWAVQKGITSGMSDTVFGVGKPCTRAQVVTFLYNAAGQPYVSPNAACPFSDVPSNAYYRKAVIWAYNNNITGGTTDSTFSPKDPCTRAQVVTFLYKARSYFN